MQPANHGTASPCPSTRSASITRPHRVDVRELVAFQPDTLGHALRDLLARPKVKEAAILSTCNRTELYVHGSEPEPVVAWLEDFHHVPKDSLAPYIYTLPREQAINHAFRVASGLDSMVLGEPQILGQMKQAVRHAESAGIAGLGAEPPVPAHVRGGQGRAHAAPTSAARRSRWPRRRSSWPSGSSRRSPTSGCC